MYSDVAKACQVALCFPAKHMITKSQTKNYIGKELFSVIPCWICPLRTPRLDISTTK